MINGKINTSDIFNLTSLPRRVISKCVVDPNICLASRQGEFIVTLKHGAVSTNSIIKSDHLNGAVKVNCDAFESSIKAVDSKDIEVKSTQHRVRVSGSRTAISIFQYPIEDDDIEIIKDGTIGLKMKMKDYVQISKFLPKSCDMVHFRGNRISWMDSNNIYIVERSTPQTFFMPRGILKSLTTGATNLDEYVIQSKQKNGDIVLRWGSEDGPSYAIRYKEHLNYKDTEFDKKIDILPLTSIGWMKIPDLHSFRDLKISEIKWTDVAISSHHNHNYNVVMQHNGELSREFITAVPNLPQGPANADVEIYDGKGIVMFKVGKWKLYASKKRD